MRPFRWFHRQTGENPGIVLFALTLSLATFSKIIGAPTWKCEGLFLVCLAFLVIDYIIEAI